MKGWKVSLQNDVLKLALEQTGLVRVCASEEDDFATQMSLKSSQGDPEGYVAVFDPLDGSSNIDASIPTGTIFGLYRTNGLQGVPCEKKNDCGLAKRLGRSCNHVAKP